MLAIYARQSVERENSVSIETQIEYCKSAIRPDERSHKVKIYKDEGASGGNMNRPDFKRLMQDVKRGRITKIIVYKLDRISRSLNDFVGILQEFKEHHVEFVSSQEAFDTSTVYGDLILKILMVFAEFERTSIINRVRDAYAKRTDMGIYMGGRKQYGFDLQEAIIHGIKTKIYVPIPEPIAHIQYIFDLYAQESVSLRMLHDNLLAHEITPYTGEDWTTAKLSTLLKNPIYVKADSAIYDYYMRRGVRIVNEIAEFDGTHAAQLYGRTTHDKTLPNWSDMKLVLAQHEGVIPSDKWLKCQSKIEKNKQIGNSISNKTSWLSGKLICTKCGHTMTTKRGETRKYFICTGKTHKKTCSGVKGTIYVEDMEYMVEDCIAEKLKSLKSIRRQMKETDATQLNSLKLKIAEIEQQEKLLGDRLLDGNFNAAMMQIANKKAEELTKAKMTLIEKIEELQLNDTGIAVAIDLSKKWKTADFREKKAVASVLIRSIMMYEDGTSEIIWNF